MVILKLVISTKLEAVFPEFVFGVDVTAGSIAAKVILAPAAPWVRVTDAALMSVD